MHAIVVAKEAAMNVGNNGPHRVTQFCKSAPRSINGVAKLRESNCKDLDTWVPPDFVIPTEAKKKDRAMAVTGGPKSFPTVVVFPSFCARADEKQRVATFPQVSEGSTSGRLRAKALRTASELLSLL